MMQFSENKISNPFLSMFIKKFSHWIIWRCLIEELNSFFNSYHFKIRTLVRLKNSGNLADIYLSQ